MLGFCRLRVRTLASQLGCSVIDPIYRFRTRLVSWLSVQVLDEAREQQELDEAYAASLAAWENTERELLSKQNSAPNERAKPKKNRSSASSVLDLHATRAGGGRWDDNAKRARIAAETEEASGESRVDGEDCHGTCYAGLSHTQAGRHLRGFDCLAFRICLSGELGVSRVCDLPARSVVTDVWVSQKCVLPSHHTPGLTRWDYHGAGSHSDFFP